MSVRSDSIPRRPVMRATSCKVVLPTELTPDHRRSVYDRFMIHWWSVRKLAMADGQPEIDIEDALRQRFGEEMARIARREFVRGRLSVMPPANLRRAA